MNGWGLFSIAFPIRRFVYLKFAIIGCVPFGLEIQVITFEVSNPAVPPASVAAAKPFGSEGVIDVDETPDF